MFLPFCQNYLINTFCQNPYMNGFYSTLLNPMTAVWQTNSALQQYCWAPDSSSYMTDTFVYSGGGSTPKEETYDKNKVWNQCLEVLEPMVKELLADENITTEQKAKLQKALELEEKDSYTKYQNLSKVYYEIKEKVDKKIKKETDEAEAAAIQELAQEEENNKKDPMQNATFKAAIEAGKLKKLEKTVHKVSISNSESVNLDVYSGTVSGAERKFAYYNETVYEITTDGVKVISEDAFKACFPASS